MSKNSSEISNENKQGMLFCPKLFPKNRVWDRNFENQIPDSESLLPRYHVCQFSDKTKSFDFFSSNLPKNEFWSQTFKNLSTNSESAPPRYHLSQFLVNFLA